MITPFDSAMRFEVLARGGEHPPGPPQGGNYCVLGLFKMTSGKSPAWVSSQHSTQRVTALEWDQSAAAHLCV